MVKGEKDGAEKEKKKMASVSPCGKVTWEASAALPSHTPRITRRAETRRSPAIARRRIRGIFPPVLRVGPSGRPDGGRSQGTGDPMWRSDQEVIQPTVFYPYRLTFLKDTSSHMIKSRGNPCTPIIMWARQGTNHTDLR